MNINNIQSIVLRLAVTMAFASGALAITAGIWVSQLSGDGLTALSGLEWLQAGGFAVVYAIVSGLVVDAIRLVFDLEWRDKDSIGLRNTGTLNNRAL